MNIFGFQITRAGARVEDLPISNVVEKDTNDGTIGVSAGGIYGTFLDMSSSAQNEIELINRYRAMALQSDCDLAISDIINEAIVKEDNTSVITINTSKLDGMLSPQIIQVIENQFDRVKDLLNIEQHGYEIFRRYYVDGRLYYNIIINNDAPEEGIVELRYVDPRRIHRVKETKDVRIDGTTIVTKQTTNEYYLYSDSAVSSLSGQNQLVQSSSQSALKLSLDSVVYINSGLVDRDSNMVVGHLHKAIRPLNQLRMLEDASIIYRLARAPERLAFYIDTGQLPNIKAEQYLRDQMVKFKNKLVYDSTTGSVLDARRFVTMREDFWLQRKEGSRGTEIQTIPGGQNLGEMRDIEYFRTLFYQSLNVPVTRLQPNEAAFLGRTSEISRDEVKFQKFINRLRARFSELFYEILGKQLVLTRVMSIEEWEEYKKHITFTYARDNFFSELKDAEIFRERIASLDKAAPYLGTFFSKQYFANTILKMTNQEYEEMLGQIQQEGLLRQPEQDPPS